MEEQIQSAAMNSENQITCKILVISTFDFIRRKHLDHEYIYIDSSSHKLMIKQDYNPLYHSVFDVFIPNDDIVNSAIVTRDVIVSKNLITLAIQQMEIQKQLAILTKNCKDNSNNVIG